MTTTETVAGEKLIEELRDTISVAESNDRFNDPDAPCVTVADELREHATNLEAKLYDMDCQLGQAEDDKRAEESYNESAREEGQQEGERTGRISALTLIRDVQRGILTVDEAERTLHNFIREDSMERVTA